MGDSRSNTMNFTVTNNLTPDVEVMYKNNNYIVIEGNTLTFNGYTITVVSNVDQTEAISTTDLNTIKSLAINATDTFKLMIGSYYYGAYRVDDLFEFNIDANGKIQNAPAGFRSNEYEVTGNGTDTLTVGEPVVTTPQIVVTSNLDNV
jgi:hypothetical protein